jgi:uncharacterized membrane protein YkoI
MFKLIIPLLLWHDFLPLPFLKKIMGMKMLFPVLVVSIALMSNCNNDKKDKKYEMPSNIPIVTVVKTAEIEGKSVEISTGQVPDSVRLSFTSKNPKADKVVWMKYEPVEADDVKMDDTYYYVRYNNSGADYTSWYNNKGNWVKTSTRITGNPNLPDAVNKTINAQYPGYTIVEIDKENDKDMEMYEIELKNGEAKAKLKVLPDGTVHKKKSSN